MLLKKILVATVLLCCGVNAQAADADAATALTQLLLNVKTMQADFTQIVTARAQAALPPTTGHMALARPGKFRWQILRPIAQLIIANGQRLWVYDVDLEQVTIRSLTHAAGLTPALLLSASSLNLTHDFRVQSLPNPSARANQPIFLLLPKDPDDPFASIRLTFLHNTIREMRLADRLGHITTITFTNVQIGTPLPATLFEFKPQPNVDVIDETKPPG